MLCLVHAFSGEAGTFHPSANSSRCLDSTAPHDPPVRLVACADGKASQMWMFSSVTGQLSSTTTQPCIVKSHGTDCHFCLDADREKGEGSIDLFDCKPQDSNQEWGFDVKDGAAPVTMGSQCLAYGG